MANTKITAANIDSTSTGFTFADLTVNGDINLGDNDKAIFGAGSDLQIYSDGDSAFINEKSTTGSLFIEGDNIRFRTTDTSKTYALFTNSGSVRLYHDNSIKLETTSTGIDVTGDVHASGLLKVGTNDSEYANNYIRFKPTGASYIDHFTVGQDINFRVSNASSLDTTALTIDSSGNVGIGETSPDGELHVKGTSGGNGDVYVERTSGAKIHLQAQSANGKIGTATNHNLGLNTNGTTRLTIDTSGNVGINAVNPTTRLNVRETGATIASGNAIEGSTQKGILLENTANDSTSLGLWYSSPSGNHQSGISFQRNDHNTTWGTDIRFYTHENATVNVDYARERCRIDSEGHFGIGTTSPSEALHIEYNTVSGGDNYIHMRKTDQGAGQGVFIGMPTASNNLRIMNHANNAITFHTQTSDAERFRIDTNGVRLEDGAMAYEQNRPLFSGANASSYSDSTNLAYTKATDQYSVTGEAFKARVRARAYTKYVHMKTNLSSDNIMFFFRIYGYFYNYGVNECVRGGYTYNTSNVIQEAVANAYNTNTNYTIGDFYRSSSGNYLCVRLDVHQTAYTEGEALVFFGSHSNTVTRELEITDMQHRDDGNNAY